MTPATVFRSCAAVIGVTPDELSALVEQTPAYRDRAHLPRHERLLDALRALLPTGEACSVIEAAHAQGRALIERLQD